MLQGSIRTQETEQRRGLQYRRRRHAQELACGTVRIHDAASPFNHNGQGRRRNECTKPFLGKSLFLETSALSAEKPPLAQNHGSHEPTTENNENRRADDDRPPDLNYIRRHSKLTMSIC